MPDPVLYSQAMLISAIVSVIMTLMIGWNSRSTSASRKNAAVIIGMAAGLFAGISVLQLRLRWPPVNGLDRLLTFVVPVVFAVELAAIWPRFPAWLAWLFRLTLSIGIPRVLLHQSVYLGSTATPWTAGLAAGVLAGSGTLLAVVWYCMWWLSRRSPGASIPLSLALAVQAAGVAIILAGYVTGGAAALPLAAVLVGVAIATVILGAQSAAGAIGIAVVGLFGLVFVGRFFGGLSSTTATTLFLAPLLCWVSEVPIITRQRPWVVATCRIVAVAIPLIVVLILIKQEFDLHTRPLLGKSSYCPGLAPCVDCLRSGRWI